MARFTSLGWAACAVLDMDEIYYKQLPRSDVARCVPCLGNVSLLAHVERTRRSVERLEIFDELEEWHMIQVRARGAAAGARAFVSCPHRGTTVLRLR